MAAERHVALLRGINVGGRNKIPMAELRACAEACGWRNVQTYIQSGNVVFDATAKAAALESQLEKAISKRLDLSIPVIVRTAAQWRRYASRNPLMEKAEQFPSQVALTLAKSKPARQAAAALQERAKGGEIVILAADALWIHFASGAGDTKLTPALLDRLVGSTVTTRNWRTVLKLRDLL